MTRSRPWLVVTALAVLFVVATALTYVLVRGTTTPSTTTPAAAVTPTSPPSAPPPTLNPSAGDAGPDDSQVPGSKTEQSQWEPVALGFAQALTTSTDNPTVWRARLARYATPALQGKLATVDPRRLPGGRYTDHEVIQYDDTSAVIVATYTKNWAVAISVISDGNSWKVYQYDRWEG